MATINEFSIWEPNIYELETTDPVIGGPTGISNLSRQQLTNRTRKIFDVLEENGIFITESNHIYEGQNIDVTATFEGTVADGDLVYWHEGNAEYTKAIADGTEKATFVGVADVTKGKVIAGGFLENPVVTGVPAQNDILFLSNTVAGQMTTSSSNTPVGKWLWNSVISLNSGVGGGGAGQFDHEQDTYRMLLNDSWFLNGTWDNLFDVSILLDPGYTMSHDFGENKFDFTAGQLFETTNLYDPTLAITVDRAFPSIDMDDSGATVIELTADGGANWEVATNNAVHDFSNTGTDLRLRVTGGGTGSVRSYGVLYNPDVNLWNNMAAILHSAITDDEPLKHYAESAIRHSVIVDDEAAKHRLINDGSTSTTVLWSGSYINSLINGIQSSGIYVGDNVFKMGTNLHGDDTSILYDNLITPIPSGVTGWSDFYFFTDKRLYSDTPRYIIFEGRLKCTTNNERVGLRIRISGTISSLGGPFGNDGGSPGSVRVKGFGSNPNNFHAFQIGLDTNAVGNGWEDIAIQVYRSHFLATGQIDRLQVYWNSSYAVIN